MKTIWQGILKGKLVSLTIDNDVIQFQPLEEGLISDIAKGVVGFAKAHPLLTTMFGIVAYNHLKQNIDKAMSQVKIRSKDLSEQSKMSEVVEQMKKDGWKVVDNKYIGKQYEWTLQRR